MSNTLTIIILGLYTLVYVFVFIIQKSQIDKQKATVESMKNFMSIFNLDKVKDYVEVSNEAMRIKLNNDIEKHNKEFLKDSEGYISKALEKEVKRRSELFDQEYNEVCRTLIVVILQIPIEKRMQFIKEYLPLTEKLFIKNLKDNNEILDE